MLRDFQARLDLNAARQRQAHAKRLHREYMEWAKAQPPEPRPTEAELDAFYADAAFRPATVAPRSGDWWPDPYYMRRLETGLADADKAVAKALDDLSVESGATDTDRRCSDAEIGARLSRFAAAA